MRRPTPRLPAAAPRRPDRRLPPTVTRRMVSVSDSTNLSIPAALISSPAPVSTGGASPASALRLQLSFAQTDDEYAVAELTRILKRIAGRDVG